jgi:hypothetical protein
VFLIGFIGNIINISIFTRPILIKNPCSIYFLCLSIANLNVLFFGSIIRLLSDGFGIDLISYNLGFCKCRYFILHSSLSLSSWFTVLAGTDRYCVSSRNVRRRQLSNLKYSRYLVVLTTIIGLAAYSHVLGLFTIEQLTTGPYCYAQSGAYQIFYDLFYFANYSFIPPIIMIIVGLATLHNVNQTRVRVEQVTTYQMNVNQLRKRDRQLVKMLLIQFIITIALTPPDAIHKIYLTFTANVIKDAYRVAIENFLAEIVRMFTFINASTSFFV